jgi:hypothetical protein
MWRWDGGGGFPYRPPAHTVQGAAGARSVCLRARTVRNVEETWKTWKKKKKTHETSAVTGTGRGAY